MGGNFFAIQARACRAVCVLVASTAIAACGIAVVGLVDSPTAEAKAKSTYTVVKDAHVKMALPKTWKKVLARDIYTQGHSSGNYHADVMTKGGYLSGSMIMRIDGYDRGNPYKAVASKTAAEAKKNKLEWKLKNKKGNSASLQVSNVYLAAWDKAYGKTPYDAASKATYKKLITIFSKGKASYAKVTKWSRAKARKKGVSAIYSYTKRRIILRIALR